MTKRSVAILLFFCLFSLSSKSQNNLVITDTVQAEQYRITDLKSEFKTFKNTNIRIKPPLYFEEFSSDEVSGFMNPGSAASIVAFEYPETPFIGFYDEVASEAFGQADNAEFLGSEEARTVEGSPAKFYFYGFSVDDVEIIRIMFLTGDKNQMVFLQANYPLAFDPIIRQVIVQSFLTVQYK